MCYATSFTIVPSPAALVGYDQTTHLDGTISIDSSTETLTTLFNPTRTFASRFAVQSYDLSNNLLLDSINFVIEVSFDCDAS